ncbi:MAG TPA: hypothetical protein VGX94_13240 [Terriglobia bacterium]|nr:hypothetical protein [Terriglobia bacterium]
MGSRRLRAAAIWFLFAAQLQLVFAAELHRHGYPCVTLHQHPVLTASSAAPPPASSSETECIACQIVRQSSARPATIGQAPRPAQRIIFHLAPFWSSLPNLAVTTLPVRGPPSLG